MTNEEFFDFIHQTIPQSLFHVMPTDIDDETGGTVEDVILVQLIAENIGCLKHRPLNWFIETFITSQ
jgi:hypothetical protein